MQTSLAFEKPAILSVSDVLINVNDFLAKEYDNVWIKGEISNFKPHPSGHYYFSIKDNSGQISAVMFKGFNKLLKFNFENGLSIIVRGRLAIYEAQGRFQIQVTHAEPDGLGALQLAYEQLKEKLENEGLFDQEHKKPLPKLPQKLGVITALSGAAIKDIVSVAKRRFPNIDIIIFPVAVQGEKAYLQISKAIEYFCKNTHLADVLIVGRGGGSIEDLWAFNEEKVARAIFNCPIPIVSAVGHETDFTISDFVADLRAPTPSAAAEHCVPVKKELLQNILFYQKQFITTQTNTLSTLSTKIKLLKKSLPSPRHMLETQQQRVNELEDKLLVNIKDKILNIKHSLEKNKIRLELLAPQNLLKRGYLIGKNKSGKVITRKDQLAVNDEFTVTFYDGNIKTTVIQNN